MKPESNTLFDGLKALVREAVYEELQEALRAQTPKAPKLLITAAEAADLLSVPKTWLEARERDGSLSSLKCGHYRLFKVVDLESFIDKAKSDNAQER